MMLTKQSKNTIFLIIVIICILISPLIVLCIKILGSFFIMYLGDKLFDSLSIYDFGNSLFGAVGISDSVREVIISIGAGIVVLFLIFHRLYIEAKYNEPVRRSKLEKNMIVIFMLISIAFLLFLILNATIL